MNKITKIYYKVIVIAAIGIYILSTINFHYSQSLMKGHIEEYTKETALYLSGQIDSWTKRNGDIISSMESLLKSTEDDKLILRFMEKELERSEDYVTLYYLDIKNNHMINASGWIAPDNFDFSSRPWYQNSINDDGLKITDIFMNASKDSLIVTFSKRILGPSGEVIGIVAGDVRTENIVKFIERSTCRRNSYSVLIDRKNEYISNGPVYESDFERKNNETTMGIILDEVINNNKYYDIGISHFEKGDTRGFIKVTSIEKLDWKLVSFYPEREYIQSFNQLKMSSNLTSIIIIMITIFMGYYISHYIVKPMFEIEEQVALFDFEDNLGKRILLKNTGAFKKLVTQINNILDSTEKNIVYLEKERQKGKELNERLLKKTQEMEQFIYITSHDLRSPLVNIQGFSSELEYSVKSIKSELKMEKDIDIIKNRMVNFYEHDINESLRFIKSSTKKMDSLLKGLLKISRVGRIIPNIVKVDMTKAFIEIQNNFRYQLITQKVELVINDIPDCYGDYSILNQIFSNLIENAIKNMKDHDNRVIIINGYSEGDKSTYIVMDNGIGIDPKYQKDIFKIFTKLDNSKDGEGLGLAIIQTLIEKLNGSITLESESGKGTSFFVELNNVDWRKNDAK